MIDIILTIFSLISIGFSINSTAPTWIQNTQIKAGTHTFFSSFTAAGTVQQFTIVFSNGGFTAKPHVAYGISKYRAEDYILEELFNFGLIAQDQGFIQIEAQLNGVTNLHFLQISYIAFSQTGYPYFLNIITDIPLGFYGGITTLTTASPTLVYETEDIDYTNDLLVLYPGLGPTATTTSFTAPFTNYKIALFLTALQIYATTGFSTQLSYQATVINQSFYRINVTFGYNGRIDVMKFCQVFINTADYDVNSSRYLVFYEWTINSNVTNFYQYNSALSKNFIMGLKSFKSTSGQCVLEYQWENKIVNSVHGAQVLTSIPNDPIKCGLSQTTNTILLFMTWICPNPYLYFNQSTNLCQTACTPYYYPNSTDFYCYPCINTLCYECHENNTSVCTACATNMVISNGTCLCNTTSGALLQINGSCFSCNNLMSFCQVCTYSGNILLTYNSSNFACSSCNKTANAFMDFNANACVVCSLSNCAICANLTNCQVCNANYGINTLGQCSTCPVFGCQTCINLTACSLCISGYVLANYLCSGCQIDCNCGGYILPRYANGDCSTLCGDGIILLPYEACDDNNTIDGDGCSSICQVQTYSTCANQPSQCYLNSNIQISLVKSQVSYSQCNMITLSFQLTPNLIFFDNPNINWQNFIIPQNLSVFDNRISTVYLNGILKITYTYTTTLQNENLSFSAYPSTLLSSSTYLSQIISNISINSTIVSSNNVAAIYCSSDVCTSKTKTLAYTDAQTGISYMGLLFSLFSCKIIGLQLFGVLQLSYFSLSLYDFVHPVLTSILGQNKINGLNINFNYNKNEQISARVQANGYTSSNFLANFNLMYLFTFLIAASGLITYAVTYLINKDNIQNNELAESSKFQPQVWKQQETRSMYLHRISKYVLKQILMTFLIFNMFNLSYSIGIQILYINESDSLSILCMLIAIVCVIAMVIAPIKTNKQEFGQYIQRFKQQKYESKYIIVTLIYRFVLGIFMAMLNEFILCAVVCIFISAGFLTYITYFDPFKHSFQNTRSKLVHLIHILILFVAFYYRMQGNYDEIEASGLSLPAYLMLISVGLCTLGSTCYLTYELIIKIKQKFFKPEAEKINEATVQNKIIQKSLSMQSKVQNGTIVQIHEINE